VVLAGGGHDVWLGAAGKQAGQRCGGGDLIPRVEPPDQPGLCEGLRQFQQGLSHIDAQHVPSRADRARTPPG